MKTTLHICAILLFTVCLLTSCSTATLPVPIVQHNIETISGFSETWVLNNIYITQNPFSPMTGAAEGKFCFLGNLSNQAEFKINCLNAANGNILWDVFASTSSSAFAVSSKGVFIGTTGIARIARYDLDGKFIWDTSFTGNGVLRIYVVGDEIQVFNHPERLRVFDIETGDLLRKLDRDTIFIATGTEKFIYTYNLLLIDPNNDEVKWEADIKDVVRMPPLFTQDFIYVREGEIMGRAYGIDRVSGKTLWKTDDNIISNIAYSPKKEKIYVLNRDGRLLGIDKNSGATSELVQFSNTPFILNGEDQVGGYEVSYDENTNILFVTLGDSRQLFEFQEK